MARRLGYDVQPLHDHLGDLSAQDRELIERVRPYTMTSAERIVGLMRGVEYVSRASVPGSIVECGVWRGGSMMAVALTLMRLGDTARDLYLFDTFEGMPDATADDVSVFNEVAADQLPKSSQDDPLRCYAPEDVVRQALASTGYPAARVHFIKGLVEQTIPEGAPERIALLRLDTDWYESTRHELTHLYPRLATKGVLIIDDYGHWAGARRAVDEYLAANDISLLLNRLDYTGRIALKV
jgi:hypothetical protein